jgi:hypothetical protein
MEAPWYAQPLLLKLLSLVRTCLAEEHAARNGLTYTAAAVLFTPFLLRPAVDRPSPAPPPALPLPLVTQYTNHSVTGGALLMPLSADENESATTAPSSSVAAAAAFSGSLDDSPDDPSAGPALPDDFALPSADRVRAQIAAAAAGSAVVEFLLRHEGDIFAPMRRYTFCHARDKPSAYSGAHFMLYH